MQEIWQANDGDIVITAGPVEAWFKQVVCSYMGTNPTHIETISPDADPTEKLSVALQRTGLYDEVMRGIRLRPGITLHPFALDHPTVDFARDLGVPIDGYRFWPDKPLLTQVYRLNTKSGFREVATKLGLKVAPGCQCHGIHSACNGISKLMIHTGKVIVKYDRSSSGYGHMIFSQHEGNEQSIMDLLVQRTGRFSEQPLVFTVEAYMPFVNEPTVEINISNEGARILYIGDERSSDTSFSSMVMPPSDISPKVITMLNDAARRFGLFAYELGYRGVCDIDAGVTPDGELYVLETNFRRTGATYLDLLVRRLIGEEYINTHVCLYDSRRGKASYTFPDAWNQLSRKGIAFDTRKKEGALLTVDTLDIDGKWRYVVIAPSLNRAREIEGNLTDLLLLT